MTIIPSIALPTVDQSELQVAAPPAKSPAGSSNTGFWGSVLNKPEIIRQATILGGPIPIGGSGLSMYPTIPTTPKSEPAK